MVGALLQQIVLRCMCVGKERDTKTARIEGNTKIEQHYSARGSDGKTHWEECMIENKRVRVDKKS